MALSLPPWLPPVLYWNLLQTITGLTVSFTPAASPLRPLTATTTIILASALHNAMSSHFSGTRASGPVAAMCWVNVLNAIDLLVLSRASYDAQAAYLATKAEKKDQDKPQPQRTQEKLLFALQIPYNYRRINTPWQISRLPHFDPANLTYTPSRAVFLLQSSLKLAIAVLLVACLTIDPHDPHLSSVIVKLNDTPSVLLLPFRDVSPTALLTQCLFTLSFGIVTRATIVAGYTSAAVVAVLLFGADPIDWPPIAGSLSGAFSLEKLWG
ncbi:hypothetical protein BJX61DRAFT_518691 [Aspergillus egyptiacus]|nr:hypothetical protein BJX61DRAFT_518691 [Aspergillus egyptiacus]